LHISQPTISRDIDFNRNQSSSAAKTKYLGHIYYYERQNSLDGVGELMKNLWLIIDNPKIESTRTNESNELDNAVLLYAI
jgi:hypothetical protein